VEYDSLVVILQSSLSSYAGKYADSGFGIDGRGIAPEGEHMHCIRWAPVNSATSARNEGGFITHSPTGTENP